MLGPRLWRRVRHPGGAKQGGGWLFRTGAPWTSTSDYRVAAAGWSSSTRISSRAFSNFLLHSCSTSPPQLTPLEVRKPVFPHEILEYYGSLEKSKHGNLLCHLLLGGASRRLLRGSQPELRTCDISLVSLGTDRYWITVGRSRVPCASMNFTLAISIREHDSSPYWSSGRSTHGVGEGPRCAIHPKFWYCLCLSRSLFAFSGLVSWQSNKYHSLNNLAIYLCPSNSDAPIYFLHCCRLADFAYT